MHSLQELLQKNDVVKRNTRKDALRRSCIKEITGRLNAERISENELKIQRFMWGKEALRNEAIKVLSKEKDKANKIWSLYTERAVHFKTIHFPTWELRDLLDKCNKAEKDKRSFGKCFNGLLKMK